MLWIFAHWFLIQDDNSCLVGANASASTDEDGLYCVMKVGVYFDRLDQCVVSHAVLVGL